jgi:hypothetical protein
MRDSSKKSFNNIVIEHFKKSKQAALYDTIHVLTIDHNPKLHQELLELKKKLGSNRAGVLVLVKEPHYFDPGTKISRQWIMFKDILLKYQIFNCDFFITCLFFDSTHNNSIEYLNTNHYDWLFHKFNVDIIPHNNSIEYLNTNHYDWLFHKFNVDIIPYNCKLVNDVTELFLEECHMKFSHLNFTHRMHRQLFSKFLIKEELVQDNLVAINPFQKDIEEAKGTLIKAKDKLIEFDQNDGWFYNKNLLDLWRDVPLEYHRHPSIDDNFNELNLNFLNKASFNIVSETVFNYPFSRFTEKTIQSLLSKRPFIMIGPCGNLQHLRDRGFKTFHTIINESYDKIEDPNKRLEAVMQLVLELNKKSQQELNDMVYAVKDTLIHNYSLMLEKIRYFTNITE